MYLLGIDIGGTKSAVTLGTPAGVVETREQFATASKDETIGKLIELAKKLSSGRTIAGCGISCGGPLSSRQGLILSPPNLPGWDRVPIVARVEQALGIKARLENDANAGAVAEWLWGFDRQIDNLVYLTCGTGQGAGLILDGKLYRGRQDLAGEIGHVRLRDDGPVGFHKAGSIEGFTAAKALGDLARIRLSKPHGKTVLDATPAEKLDGKAVGEAAVAGDAIAVEIVRELGTHLGQACAMLIDLLNPQRISLGSLAVRLGDLLLAPVREQAKKESIPLAFENCVIDKAGLGQRVQDLAAIAVARVA